MIEFYLVGIGMGNPFHVTRAVVEVLQSVDLILIPNKGATKADLADLRSEICEQLLSPVPPTGYFDLPSRTPAEPEYLKCVNDWYDAIAGLWQETIQIFRPNGGTIALMIWRDPSLYDSSVRIAERLKAKNTTV
jgi:precorrin-6A synthase